MTHALAYLQKKGSAEGFEDHLRHLADQDEEKTYSNYGLIRFICWVTPVLGILGTVIHFGSAFGGMSVDEIGDKLAIVLGEIGNAFHTTTVALAAAITMMFSLYLCERTDRGIVRRINRRVDRELLSRFEVVDEKLTPFINAVEVANHASLAALDESVHRQLKIWSGAFHSLQHENEQKLKSHAQLWEQSMVKMHERFEQSDSQREQKLLRLLGDLQLQRSEQKTQTQAMVNQMAGLQIEFQPIGRSATGFESRRRGIGQTAANAGGKPASTARKSATRSGAARLDRGNSLDDGTPRTGTESEAEPRRLGPRVLCRIVHLDRMKRRLPFRTFVATAAMQAVDRRDA